MRAPWTVSLPRNLQEDGQMFFLGSAVEVRTLIHAWQEAGNQIPFMRATVGCFPTPTFTGRMRFVSPSALAGK